MKEIKLGLIGAGGISTAHLGALAGVRGVRVVGVADIVEANARARASQCGAEHVFTDYNKLLAMDEIDGVIVATPTAHHAAPAIAALKAGKHVLCEKPMADSLESAMRMVATAHETGKMLMVGLKLRFSQTVLKAREIIAAGTLGDIYYVEAVSDRRRGNPGRSFIRKETAGFGACADIGVYPLDTALYVMGHPKPVSVSAVVSNQVSRLNGPVLGQWAPNLHETEVEDFTVAWVRFENGMSMTFKTCWAMHMDTLGGTIFLGTKAGMRLGVGEVKGPEPGIHLYRDEFGAMTNVQIQGLPGREDLFQLENAAFVDAIREGKPSPIDPDGMLLTNVIIQGAMDSAAAGGREVEVRVPSFGK